MRTWGFVNQKGGSGKTTLLIHLALAARSDGLTVAVIDTDQQRSADKWAALRATRTGDTEPVIVRGEPEALKAMVESARRSGTDLLLIDTPGTIDKTLAYVAANCDMLVVPSRSASVDRDSLDETLEYLGVIHALPKTVVVFNAFTANKSDRQATETIVLKHGASRLAKEIEQNPAYGTLLGQGRGATEKKKPGRPAQTIRDAYGELKEFDARLAGSKARYEHGAAIN